VLRWIYVIVAFVILLSLGLNDFLITSNLFVGFPNSVLFFIDFFQIPFGLKVLDLKVQVGQVTPEATKL
jgi:hypothetical protein